MPSYSLRLFQVFGITVFLHWSWFLIAALWIYQPSQYQDYPLLWSTAECLGFFILVLVQSIGTSLGCRSVGGKAMDITLWPLGTMADFTPPQRPGAVLWTFLSGSLLSLLVAIILLTCFYYTGTYEAIFVTKQPITSPQRFLTFITVGNLFILIFNLLPVYPLSGGQIARALLWYGVGRWRSLQIAAGIGALACLAGIGYSMPNKQYFLILVCCFGVYMSFTAYQFANYMLQNPHLNPDDAQSY